MFFYIWVGLASGAVVVALTVVAIRANSRSREDRVRAQEAERLLHLIVENTNDAIIHESVAGTILGWNSGAERLFGTAAAAAIGRRISTIIPPERVAGDDVILASLSAGVRLREFETHVTREDGSRVFVSVTVAPVRNDAGVSVGAVRTIRDISDRKRIEDSVVALAVELREIRRGNLDLHKQRMALAPVIERAIDMVDEATMDHPRTLEVTQLAEPVYVNADPARIEQVIGTLLTNASRFTYTGGHIWLEVERAGGEVVITVRDDGAGISASDLHRLFKLGAAPVDSRPRQVHLGLPLIKMIVEMHGGTLSAQSDGPGKGALFTLRLPLAPPIEQTLRPALVH